MSTAAPSLEDLPGSAPSVPTPAEQVADALAKISALQGLTAEERLWLVEHGEERFASAGTLLFREGAPVQYMSIILAGEIHVRRDFSGAFPLFVGRAGQITGVMPFSRMRTYGGTGYAVGEVWALLIHHEQFDAMLEAIPSMAQRSVSILLDRVREVTRIEQQAEKLNALGKLAGNLAHELNNPASAAQRAASGLLQELRTYGQSKYELGAVCPAPATMQQVRAWQDDLRARSADCEPVTVAGREDRLSAWFRDHGMGENNWTSTPELSECGVEPADLDRLHALVPGQSMLVVLRQFSSSLRAERMTGAMLDATERIFELINAVKAYSFMDQAPIQEVDVAQGLDNTLAMLQARLNGIEVVRQFEPDLPTIAAYGSELNQVWMALFENAIDALQEREREAGSFARRIQVRAQLARPFVIVEIEDNGHGIPPEIRDRIFEPFFSTRPPGGGLGRGMDTVQRIVHKHRGYVNVDSESGRTCFQVRLPSDPLQAY